ncbi:MAG: 5-(carboxyamino)imidazole ribonucleotide synthase, partial [Betaproteobacteria bacterium]|nr:5-(carboxyamino)imidazole ribonucleotide synthase [Betaproteobacteria bacterium]
QLGRMFAQSAQAAGYEVVVLEPQARSPAALVTTRHVARGYDDADGLHEVARQARAVTVEFENVPAAALQWLDAHVRLAPHAPAVAVCQDRAEEKALFTRLGVACAPHALVAGDADCRAAQQRDLFPGILKTARMGYDGKGQVGVRDARELPAAWRELGGVPCVLERRLDLDFELSVVLARGADGQLVHFPPQRNVHRDGILFSSAAGEDVIPAALAERAAQAARGVAEGLGYVGVLCVVFFVTRDGSLVANEMAPRPHNSGHHTMDSCDVSQFELQWRCLVGAPLPQPRRHSAALMLNLLGDLWFDAAGAEREPDWAAVLRLPGAHLHLYGKHEPRPARKMGHLTFTAPAVADARQAAARACELLGLTPP